MSAGGDGSCSTASPPSPFHLLEVTVISAQDLHRRRFGRRVRAYAVAWADQAHKVRTDVDRAGGGAPTWNDRFLFRVDDAFLRSETAAVTVEVRGVRKVVGADPVLGLTRIVVSTFLRRHSGGPAGEPSHGGRQVAALLLRRPRSLRPQGIINVAVSLLGDAHAAPLYDALDSPDAFAVKDLVTHRPASSSSRSNNKIAQRGGASHHNQQGGDVVDDEKKPGSFVDHSGRLDPKSAVFEQRKLVQTLEKWKADLSPARKEDCRRSTWRSLSPASCFRGRGDWDR
jgi:hypothetical protein